MGLWTGEVLLGPPIKGEPTTFVGSHLAGAVVRLLGLPNPGVRPGHRRLRSKFPWPNIFPVLQIPPGLFKTSAKGAGLFQRAGQTMKQAAAKGTSRYLIGIKS